MNILRFFIERWDKILNLTMEHLLIVLIAMSISIILGLFIGILITYNEKFASIVLSIAGIFMTIPSLALFAIMIPILGIGKVSAIVALILYTQLPIIRNVYIGVKNIDPNIIESARGMGLSRKKILYKVKLPLAFPVIMVGVRTAVVMGVGIGAIAAYIGAGGLGDYIFQGISRSNDKMVIIGAIIISILSIILDKSLKHVQEKYEL
ncbi:ABC-type proline/glycine betaine transport system, permease component [Gottschalkia purinilytica]|uniref:ABC-type proline/glycine betaine transport system, permease component n=1 Tax=Gottschalkia purinilytica TaxID=1503 RepID=A0A0L0W736_GOTPU|nr:ABC transporter permease [Gottschalkia purinilytica]KNF07080.1 ABC-type proline/glycine betaine transport system, permease component [Gottschalkia purinilytica]